MLALARLDLGWLAEALGDHSPEGSWFIDADTGEIWRWSPDYDDDRAFDPDHRRDARPIDPLPSRVGYTDMEDFVESVADVRAADLLARALAGRGAFRRFKDTLLEFPELRERWFAFRDARMRRRALEFLLDEALVDATEVQAALAALDESASPVAQPDESASAAALEIAYRWRNGRWTAALSIGGPLELVSGNLEFHAARTEFRNRLAARLAVPVEELGRHVAAEHVQPAEWGGIEWHGLRFALLAPDYGVDDPSAEQRARLRACFEYYRDNVPEGMKVEYYANRVRIEPGAFGQRRALIDAIGGALAAHVPDEWTMATGPVSSGLDQAREQFRRALLLEVPEGFVRVTTGFEGFEDEGTLGTIHLLLKERWDLDRPW